MGIAAYNRSSNALSQRIADELAEKRNTLEAKALLWSQLIKEGEILTFKKNRTVWTIGPYQAAIARPWEKFAVVAYKSRHGQSIKHFGQSWSAALYLVEHIGRIRPWAAQ